MAWDMNQVRVQTPDKLIVRRPIPIVHVQISATTSGAANSILTVRDRVMLEVKKLSVNNISGTAATLSLNSIPSGGSIGDSNAEAKGVSIPANTMVDLTDFIGGLYGPGVEIQAYSGTTNALVIHGWAEEIL